MNVLNIQIFDVCMLIYMIIGDNQKSVLGDKIISEGVDHVSTATANSHIHSALSQIGACHK